MATDGTDEFAWTRNNRRKRAVFRRPAEGGGWKETKPAAALIAKLGRQNPTGWNRSSNACVGTWKDRPAWPCLRTAARSAGCALQTEEIEVRRRCGKAARLLGQQPTPR